MEPLAIPADGQLRVVFDARQNALRPFTFIRWHYAFVLDSGETIQSETYSIRYDDNRFAWQRLESNALHVSWIQGDASCAGSAMDAAQAGVRTIDDIFPVDLSRPINVFIYPSQNEISFLARETRAAGHADAALGVTLVVIEPGLDQGLHLEQRIPHELMHVLLYRQVGAGYASLPAWLREGLAAMVEINRTL